jgi:hypothetical protein
MDYHFCELPSRVISYISASNYVAGLVSDSRQLEIPSVLTPLMFVGPVNITCSYHKFFFKEKWTELNYLLAFDQLILSAMSVRMLGIRNTLLLLRNWPNSASAPAGV